MQETSCRPAQAPICVSLASWAGLTHKAAMDTAAQLMRQGELAEPALGTLSLSHVQLVPQSRGELTESLVQHLRHLYPDTQFRLHANVNVLPSRIRYDLAHFDQHRAHFAQAARLSQCLGAGAYSAHPGRAGEATLAEVFDHARRAADIFDCPVAIEGLYPDRGQENLLRSWDDYQALFESGVPYAVDLSHVNILVRNERRREDSLLQEMLACERCLEVHLSDNDGRRDAHEICRKMPWWGELLPHIHPAAVIFSEGIHRALR